MNHRMMNTLQRVVSRLPSYRVVEMPTDSSSPFEVDKGKLMQLTKNKDQDVLQELGGVDRIILSLKTHAGHGIRGDAADLRNRIRFFESNSYRIRGVVTKNLLAILYSFKEFSFLFLSACSLYLVIVGIMVYGWKYGWQDGTYSFLFSFIFAVISSTIGEGVGVYFDKAIEGSQLVIVLRNGLKQQIPVSSVLVGDIALLRKGDKIPADGLFLEAYGALSVKLDESDEGRIVEINCSDPFLSTGDKVVEGQAKMMVTSTAVGTNFSGSYEITELRAQINYLIRLLEITKWVLAMSSVLISLSSYFSGTAKDDQGDILFNRGTTSALEVSYMIVAYITTASVIFVAMDTSNFSWALKICFAHAIIAMAACNVIVRNLRSWEKIGLSGASVNVMDEEFIASNQLITSKFLFVPQMTENKKPASQISSYIRQLIQQGIGLNTTGISNHTQRRCELKFSGSPSERAFLSQAALESDMDWKKLNNDCAIVEVKTLENHCRVMTVKKDDSFLEHRRGPAEVILAMCSGYYDNMGILQSLNESIRGLLEQRLGSIISDSRTQVIALACRQVPNQELKEDSHLEENEDCCNLLGFVVLKEVDQDVSVQNVVQKCRNAGLDLNIFHAENNLDSGVAGATTAKPEEMRTNLGLENQILALGTTTGEDDITDYEGDNRSEEITENRTELAATKNFGSEMQLELLQEIEQNNQKVDLDNGDEITELVEMKMNQVSGDGIVEQGKLGREQDINQSEEVTNESKEDSECSKKEQETLGREQDINQSEEVTNESKEDSEYSKEEQGTLGREQDINQSEEVTNESKEDSECSKEVASVSRSDDHIVSEQIHDATDLAPVEHEVTALSEATTSISIGFHGDEPRTSDIVILDGKFATLPLILMWAKCMLLNTQAFTQFQLTVMITSIWNAFISSAVPQKTSAVDKTLAYQLVQQTWVNTGMGLIAALTFGRQRPSPAILLRKPPGEEKNWKIITGFVFRNIITQSLYQVTVVSVLQFEGSTIFGFTDREVDTTTFLLPIFLQVLNMVSARKIEEKNIFSGIRPRFIWIIAALMVAPIALVEILAATVDLERLDGKQWAICVAIALVSWPVGFAAKFVPVRFFVTPVRIVVALVMAVVNLLKELGNWIKSKASKLAFW